MTAFQGDVVKADIASVTRVDSAVAAEAAPKSAYPPVAPVPTQQASRGLRFDFNLGCRVQVPAGNFRVRLRDLDTGNTLYETTTGSSTINSSKRYYIRFGVEVWDGETRVFAHDYDAAGQDVLIQFPVGTLGDLVGWFPYAVKFARQHGCRLTCAMGALIIPLFEDAYPDITFLPHEAVEPERYYASYRIGLFFDDTDCIWQPCDFRLVGLHRTAGHILGVDPAEQPPLLALPDETRPIDEPYVCIAVQSSSRAKYWNNPNGWRETVAFLKASGYRVICIDQKPSHGSGIVWTDIPHGVEDQTGDRPLTERARLLRHAAAFVGLSSGLAWLAWAAGCPVVMISGFTHPSNEFASPYRVINYHACNSCWNDPHHRFDHKDFLWCPRHANTPRQFECTRLITPHQVCGVLRRLPGFPAAIPPPG
ncbi:autotransporter strand-loop-strand O-heptosyltransferase [Rhodopila sp.]|uniref:autotransporter strand-loop-strand O-heptosyltransferase n=1 Tax=Rhodopila sp. TaxID=2480087 RepID=UPI003D0F3A56